MSRSGEVRVKRKVKWHARAMCATMQATDVFVTNKRGFLHDVTSIRRTSFVRSWSRFQMIHVYAKSMHSGILNYRWYERRPWWLWHWHNHARRNRGSGPKLKPEIVYIIFSISNDSDQTQMTQSHPKRAIPLHFNVMLWYRREIKETRKLKHGKTEIK